MLDKFFGYSDSVTSPATRAAAITPIDTADLPEVPKGVYVGSGGDIVMIGRDAPAGAPGVTWKNVPAGALIPFRPRRILSTGTTAADMLALL